MLSKPVVQETLGGCQSPRGRREKSHYEDLVGESKTVCLLEVCVSGNVPKTAGNRKSGHEA